MLNTQDLITEIDKLEWPSGVKDREERFKARSEYNFAIKALERRWQDWLAETYVSSFPTVVQNMIYDKTWEDHHSHGYNHMEDAYVELGAWVDKLSLHLP